MTTANKQSIINFRTKASVKKEANEIFDKMGMDMSTAMNTFLHSVIIHRGMPMNLVTENGYTVDQEKKILEAKRDKKGMQTYHDIKDFWKDVDSE